MRRSKVLLLFAIALIMISSGADAWCKYDAVLPKHFCKQEGCLANCQKHLQEYLCPDCIRLESAACMNDGSLAPLDGACYCHICSKD
uniref:Knottin scorpion toxin-like domain-containing protein n=2 Tax=Aegilops tauschii TaxID=37682 RepID=A0A453DKN4_AEGTS